MNTGEILIYQNPEGSIKIDVRLEDEMVWLTKEQMVLLFNKAKSTINEHILYIYTENELIEKSPLLVRTCNACLRSILVLFRRLLVKYKIISHLW